ncbi:MAG: hypothetical protein LBE32_03775 [Burkholderiales bacterium]|jgi:hypothetical protein|nr:hypothetical protein [Burkholderiales bacterium]
MNRLCFLMFFVLMGFATNVMADDKCGILAGQANEKGTFVAGADAQHKVTGTQRLQFHSAPDASCVIQGKFISPGEVVTAYVELNGYTSVTYRNSNTNETIEGWLLTDRLQATGYGIAPRQGQTVGLTSVKINGETLTVAPLGRVCALQYKGKTIRLQLPGPCRFLARGQGQPVAVHSYPGKGSVVLVAGPLAHLDDYARSEDRKPADQCSHMAQAATLMDGAVRVGAPILDNLGFCAAAAPDEKFYYGIAHAPR